jgi:hypothetical protein
MRLVRDFPTRDGLIRASASDSWLFDGDSAMKTWTQLLVATVLGILTGGLAVGGDGSDYLWVTAEGPPQAGKASTPAEKAAGTDRETPAESAKPAAGQWRRPAAKKPVGGEASGTSAAPEKAKGTVPPGRLPEDPGYTPPKPKAAPGPDIEEKPGAKGLQPGGAAKGTGPSRPEVTVAPGDRTPCDWCGDSNCCGTCRAARRTRACMSGDTPDDPAEKPWRLFDQPALTSRGFNIRGWADQGITTNARFPADRFNGPVTFNDRTDEYGLGQLYLVTERETKTEGQGFDVGGRVDLLYGTDSRFTTANGLDDTWNGGHRFYGLAMPQLYADFALNDWTFRVGHFYANFGYEVVPAVDNFFYSHTYSLTYGEPITLTGMTAKWQLNDQVSLMAGFHRGWNQWEDNNKELGFVGGATWKNDDWGTSISFAITASNELVDQSSSLAMYSVVLTQKLGQRWRYVLEHDGAHETNAVDNGGSLGSADWFGLTNYLFFDLNPQWSFGLRYEWFPDNSGTRVRGLGSPHGIDFPPAGVSFPAYWNDISIGMNYKPHRNVTLRCETRWDWADPIGTSTVNPFDDQTRRNQFLFDTDLIIQF